MIDGDGDGAARRSAAPLVSVIIPTFNRAAMLRLTLQTVLNQDLAGGDFEVLVIGDACTDDTAAIFASFNDPRLRWHNLPQNTGTQSEPNNTGLRMARGRYVAHLGHDDFWFPWHLSGLVATIEETGADWAYALVVSVGPTGVRYCFGPPRADVPEAEHFVPPSGWLYRREMVERVGWWADAQNLPWPIDYDVWRRAALAGATFACARRPTVLKFPAARFPDGYRSGEAAPIQQEMFARLRRDPEALERETLLDLAVRFAQQDRGGGYGVFGLEARRTADRGGVWWPLRHWLITHYGVERWPIPQLMRKQAQAHVLKRRRLRGLDDAPPPAPVADGHPAPAPLQRTGLRAKRRRRRRRRAERRKQSRAAEALVVPE